MKMSLSRKLVIIFASFALIFSVLTMNVTAMGAMGGISRGGNAVAGRSSDSHVADSGLNGDASIDNGMGNGNIDSGTDGHIDENSGTGEFADENTTDYMNGKDTGKHPVESAVDNVVTDAAGAVEDMTDGMSVWGIIIAIVVIVAAAALIFALFSRRK